MRAPALVIGAVLLALTGCGAGSEGGTKAGAGAPPVTLRIGADTDGSFGASLTVKEFARYVEAESGGSLTLEPTWQPAGPEEPDWDQWLAKAVRDGRYDLGAIPARAWDVEGVDSFRALYAPFLVTDRDLLAEISTGDLADDMLAGLDGYGVTGLALVPYGIRYVFAFGDPIRTPADLDGLAIQSPTSRTTHAMLRTLGASPRSVGTTDFDRGIEDGTLAAIESAYLFSHLLHGAPTALGDLPLFPMVDTIVIRAEVLDSLSPEHQRILRDGALHARDWTIRNAPSEQQAGAVHCAGLGSIVYAGQDTVTAFHQAAEPVLDVLETDPETARRIAAIRRLGVATAPSIAEPCTSAMSPPSRDPGEPGAIDGAFRTPDWTVDRLLEHGVSPGATENLAGVFTFTFDRGSFRLTHRGAHSLVECPGEYLIAGREVDITLTSSGECGPAGLFLRAAFDVTESTLRLTNIREAHPSDVILFGSYPWESVD